MDVGEIIMGRQTEGYGRMVGLAGRRVVFTVSLLSLGNEFKIFVNAFG